MLCSLAPAQSRFFWTETRDDGSNLDDLALDLARGNRGAVFVAATPKNPSGFDVQFLAYDAHGCTSREWPIGHDGHESAHGVAVGPTSDDCFGDRSTGPGPGGNIVAAGLVSGCRATSL